MSRKESTGSYPSIDEVTENNTNIPISNIYTDAPSMKSGNDTEMTVVTPNYANLNGNHKLDNGGSVNFSYETENSKELFNIPENN